MGGWGDEGVRVRGGGGEVIAPDAHTPTPTNYHCMIEKKEEVGTAAPHLGPLLSAETRKERKKQQ